MISHISIHNFAIIKEAEIDFRDGLNIITGETGAGKSIVLEAVSLALGGRADSTLIRHGAEKASVELLAETAQGEETVLAREISSTGKNVCRINGRLATRGELAEAAAQIADIHGQYDNQKLLDPANHLTLNDSWKRARSLPVRQAYQEAYLRYKETREALRELLQKEKEARQNEDFNRFQLKEIEEAHLKPGEDRELADRTALLANSEKIFDAASKALGALAEGEPDVRSLLGKAESALEPVRETSAELRELTEQLDSMRYDLDEVISHVRDLLDQTDFRPEDVDRAISRLDRIEKLKQKYGPEIPDVLAHAEKLRESLSSLESFDEDKRALEDANQAAKKWLLRAAEALTEVRKKNAEELSAAIEKELTDLDFPDARFRIEVRPAAVMNQDGRDACEIMVSLNRGEPLKPLAKTASGGEISRIMLGIKNVAGDYDRIPTMIFDEIDQGISGRAAGVVAGKLKDIARHHQVICITHLPQIAAAADTNYRIFKESDDQETFTHVECLSEEARIDELARLLSGDRITEAARKNAADLLARYQNKRG